MDITRSNSVHLKNTTALNSFPFYATVTKEKLELNKCYWVYHELVIDMILGRTNLDNY